MQHPWLSGFGRGAAPAVVGLRGVTALGLGAQIEDLRRQGIAVVEWHPEEPLEMVLAAPTQRRRMRRVAR